MTTEAQKRAKRAQRARDLASKKYYCDTCDKAFKDRHDLNKHLNGLKHHPERLTSHTCHYCNYTTRLKSRMTRHEQSKRHRARVLTAGPARGVSPPLTPPSSPE